MRGRPGVALSLPGQRRIADTCEIGAQRASVIDREGEEQVGGDEDGPAGLAL